MSDYYGSGFDDGVQHARDTVDDILQAFERGDIDSFETLLSNLQRWVDGEPLDLNG